MVILLQCSSIRASSKTSESNCTLNRLASHRIHCLGATGLLSICTRYEIIPCYSIEFYVITHLSQLNATALFVRGSVDDALTLRCISEDILIFSNTSFKTLKTLAQKQNVDLVTYILDSQKVGV
jgi:hypothetical protein